jgi:succinate dehydrogenase / fumarate reductase iron-sulfur subunit
MPGADPYWQDYQVQAGTDDMVLGVLIRLRETQDASLAFRSSCRSAVCGSCAMMINGRPRLACQTRVKELPDDVITLAPLTGLRVIKDLVVEMEPFWDNFKKIMPWLEEKRDGEKLRINNNVSDIQEEICACILCAACYAACPEASVERAYLGPHALMEGYRFLQDPRDSMAEKRLEVLAGPKGAWGCNGAFACINACPWKVAPIRYVAKIRVGAAKVRLGLMKAEDCCEYKGKFGD